MNLKIKDIVDLLQVSEKTIYRWIKDKKIPAYRINHQYRFNKTEIHDWILKNKIPVSGKIFDLSSAHKTVSLIDHLREGGIYYNIDGDTVPDIIKNAIYAIPTPQGMDKNAIISSLLQREEMMPTAIGKGIAIPHPRTPIIADLEKESISICFLKNRIDYGALDGILVDTIFIILSATPQRHIETLSKISFLCQQDDFISLLKNKAPHKIIVNYIRSKESEWKTKQDNNG